MNDEFTTFADIPISEGKSFKDILTFRGKNYWWYNDINIYRDFRNNHPDTLDIFISIYFFVSKYFIFFLCIIDIITFILIIIVEFFSSIKTHKLSTTPQKPVAIFKTSARRWIIEKEISPGESKIKSMYYDEIFESLENRLSIITLFTDIPTLIAVKRYIQVKVNYVYPSIALTRYWSWKVWSEEKDAISYFKGVFHELNNNDDWWKQASEFIGLPISDLKKILKYHLYCTFPLCVRHNFLMENVVKRENPSIMVLTGEQAYMGRGWMYCGNKYHIPVIGLQHGVILPNDYGYLMHDKSDIHNTSNYPFPIPDFTLVWGQNDYDLLVEMAGYPKESVLITGNPRYDRLASVSDLYSHEMFCERNGIKPSNKLIVWTTQSHGNSVKENEHYISDMCEAVSMLENVTLIIKLHPQEGNKYREYMNYYAKKYNIDLFLPSNDSNTTELIYVSNLVIIKNSTTGQEAIALHKPLIVLDYSNEPDKGHYVEEGVAIGVYQRKGLHETMLNLLDDDSEQDKARNAYIKKYMFNIDGKAAERCAEIIESMIIQVRNSNKDKG